MRDFFTENMIYFTVYSTITFIELNQEMQEGAQVINYNRRYISKCEFIFYTWH